MGAIHFRGWSINCSRVLLIAALAAVVSLVGLDAQPGLAVTTFTVDSTANTGDASPDGACNACTLREAIQEANFIGGATINFNIPGTQTGCSGPLNPVCTIAPANVLPTITAPVTIDGYSAPGASANTNPITAGSNAVLKVELDGTGAGPGANGLDISGGNSTVRGLAINRFLGQGINLTTAGGNTIAGNYIGTGISGTTDLGNGGSGIFISSTGTNSIGGETAADRNVISGNSAQGVTITGTTATGNVVWGSLIGTQADGVSALGNGQDGVHLDTSTSNNEIGDVVSGRANVIAFNSGGDGVNLVSTAGTGNAIRGNSIHDNGSFSNQLGIDLGLNGVTANDAGDGDTGANNLQNWPVLTRATSDGAGNTNVRGTLNSTASTTFNLDFYHSAACDAGGNGEGEAYLGSAQVTTDGSGNASFVASFPANVAAGRVVTATATRSALPLDTSEFSNCATVLAFVVDTTSDASLTACTAAAGDCSLRGAITNANAANSPGDVITFDATVFPSGAPATITIDGTGNGALPSLNNANGTDTIDGTGAGVIVDGAGEPSLFPCLTLENNDNTVKGLQMTDCVYGMIIIGDNNTIGPDNVIFDNGDPVNGGAGIGIGSSGTGNVIKGNKIGTNAAGSAVHPSGGNYRGLNINGSGNTVGGSTALDRNIVSGNTTGISISTGGEFAAGSNNVVKGNYIGTDAGGTADLGNTLIGVNIFQAVTGNVIGGTAAGEGNVISGNDGNGLAFFGNDAVGRPERNLVQGNVIGTNAAGTADLGNTLDGILIDGGLNNCVGGAFQALVCIPASGGRNIISGNDNAGVEILEAGGTGNKLFGNYIGTNVNGTAGLGNSQWGVNLEAGAANTIGSFSPDGPNVISGNNQNGVRISGSHTNNVFGNLIGTTASGTGALGNSNQNVRIDNANNNWIIGNVIAASGDVGVRVGGTTSGNLIQGNFIGTDASGTIPLGNASHGVHLLSASTTVGGSGASEGNVIAFNGGDGVFVESGTGNLISANAIHGNTGLGIDLGANGVTPNDISPSPPTPPHDQDTGANNLQNFPVLTSVSVGGGSTTVNGTLNSTPSTSFTIEMFYTYACDASGNGEGQTLFGSVVAATDGAGNVTFGPTFAGEIPAGRFVTATATDPSGNTSEFSACIPSLDDADDDDDGFTDVAEASIGTGSQDPCGNDGWPAELVDDNNILNIGDFNSFLFPLRGNGSFNKFGHPVPDAQDSNIARWNLDSAGAGATTIDIGDINAINPAVLAPTARPPMFGGQPAFFTNGGQCPFPP